MRTKMTIGDGTVEIDVVDHETAEKCDFLVCLRTGNSSTFDDNEEGVCSVCGHGVFFRPMVPKQPARICMECIVEMSKAKMQ